MIKDSGERKEFDTGAVRDIQEGKGRCDLMPLGVVGEWLNDEACYVFTNIHLFQGSSNVRYLESTLKNFSNQHEWDRSTMLLEASKHFEEGAKKYGENNWQKGIPVHCYIDSAIRHYLKWLRGDTDEPHDRAFIWNILCCIWTMENKPELDDFTIKKGLMKNETE